MDRNWEDVSYLKNGSPRQRKVYDLLKKTGVLIGLEAYNPILAGTLPIGIDLPESDLDIICEVYDIPSFQDLIFRLFSYYGNFAWKVNKETFVAGFTCDNFKVEIFAKPLSVKKQEAYRHMMIEWRLLTLFGESFRKEVIKAKSDGMKTEPAFCKILKIKGDPYLSLLELENYSDKELWSVFENRISDIHD